MVQFNAKNNDIEVKNEETTLFVLKGHDDPIDKICITTDQKILITKSNKCGNKNLSKWNVIIWDAETGQMMHNLKGNYDSAECMTISADNNKLLVGYYFNNVKIFNIESGELLKVLDCWDTCNYPSNSLGNYNFKKDPFQPIYDEINKYHDYKTIEVSKLMSSLIEKIYCTTTDQTKIFVIGSHNLKIFDANTYKLLNTYTTDEQINSL